MKWSNGYRMRFVLVGVVAAIMLGSVRARADFTFGEVTNLGPTVNTGSADSSASLSADGLTLFFTSNRTGGMGGEDLYMVTRETVDGDWGPATNLGPTVNDDTQDWGPSISTDGLELYFRSNRDGQNDLWVTKRETINSDWGTPVSLGPTVNSSEKDAFPSISSDGLELYFSSLRSGFGRADIWVTQRLTKDDPWQAPVNLGPTLNTAKYERAPDITADGLTLIFSSASPTEWSDLCATTRKTTADPWREPFNLGPVINDKNVNGLDYADISPDGTMLYITYEYRPGGYGYYDIWQAPIIPIVDFNGDMSVDVKDVVIMTEHWGESYSLCDIAPMPFGDGVVDTQDLIMLAEYVESEVKEPGPIVHWKLDETEGSMARDSASGEDAFVMGDPLWEPAGGMVDGALRLDGVDDCVITVSGINPAEGPFSVFAWIKGGAPGQVVLSQISGANWLCIDSSEGNLMTDIKCAGRSAGPPLLSEIVITDGQWHRIGLVWDGSYRMLYVDGIAVAEDTQDGLEGSGNGLYIGTGKVMQPGTYFLGMIDDVRIYDVALSAEEVAALAK